MQNTFSKANWIWYCDKTTPNSYGDFIDTIEYNGGTVICHLSCDGDYTLFVNGKFASSNQYGDFEHYKIYDSIDITPFLNKGKNEIYILVWHIGMISFRYKLAQAGLLYQIENDGNVLAASSENTLSRENPNYKSGYEKTITPQIGPSYLFDATVYADTKYTKSVNVEKNCTMYPLPIKKLVLGKKINATMLKNEGNHFLLDLGRESVGLLTFKVFSKTNQKMTVTWGEHIESGGVQQKIWIRDFSIEYVLAAGENEYTNYMLRHGGRYIEVFCDEPIEVEYITIIPQSYPVCAIQKKLDNPLDQSIYDLCVRTLELCMMEHYVDTPWREQSLYVFDSRNQIMCGYNVFEGQNKEYARANLLLMSKDKREDDLLSITYPCGRDLVIPSFSLHYFTAVKEYIEHTDDASLGVEVFDKLCSITEAIKKQVKNGLAHTFGAKSYWNFYDWSPFMDDQPLGRETEECPDLMLNCLFIYALKNLKYICQKIDKEFKYSSLISTLEENTKKAFFNKDAGLFSMNIDQDNYTELGNIMAVMAGLTTKEESLFIAQQLAQNKLIPCALNMLCFKYDVLLSVDKSFCDFVREDIRKKYKPMLDRGATSVWEYDYYPPERGRDGGSLCHAWNAFPVLYL